MDSQSPEINPETRKILINWIIKVHSAYKFQNRILYLTVNIIDRYLSKRKIQIEELQLVGIGAFLIASKYEGREIMTGGLATISCNNYTKKQICEMELDILKTIDYSVTVITISDFVYLLCKENGIHSCKENSCNKEVYSLCEKVLLKYDLVIYPPSNIAAACVMIAFGLENFNFYKVKEVSINKICMSIQGVNPPLNKKIYFISTLQVLILCPFF